MRWMLDGKCRHGNPNHWISDNPIPAEVLCSGCPVVSECAEHALTPINITDFIEHLTGVRLDEEPDIVSVSGVKLAGVKT